MEFLRTKLSTLLLTLMLVMPSFGYTDQPTNLQWGEVFKQVNLGKLTKVHIRALLKGKNPFAVQEIISNEQATIQQAIQILGAGKVITEKVSVQAWKLPDLGDIPLRYKKATLIWAQNENSLGNADWRLIWVNGLSLIEQRNIKGTDCDNHSCFDDNDWWLDDERKYWLNKGQRSYWAEGKPEEGYYLINLHGLFANTHWNIQNQGITKLERQERTNETVFSEVIQTIFFVTKELIADDWRHSGSFIDGRIHQHVTIKFGSSGLYVNGHARNILYSDSIRVSIYRKFDF